MANEAINLVKQKTRIALEGANPEIQRQFSAFWNHMATHKGNPDLTITVFSDMTVDAAVEAAACKLYAIYVKKGATATDAFYNVFDDATDDSTAADAMISLGLTTASEEAVYFQPKGRVMAAGVVHGSYTALIGYNATTASTSGDGPSGFVITGAA